MSDLDRRGSAAGADASALVGHWRVRRLSGLMPPWGVTKRIGLTEGCTFVFGIRFGCFDLRDRRFIYRFWPIVDEIVDPTAAEPAGVGRIFGLSFCRFSLQRLRSPGST